MKLLLYFNSIFLLFVATICQGQTIKIPGSVNENKLPHTLLKTIFKRAGVEAEFPYKNISSTDISSTRLAQDINTGKIDLMWKMTSKELEENFTAVYIPIFRGLLSMRIPLVTKSNENLFAKIDSFDEFKKYKAGSGKFWADTPILEHNGIPVVKTLKYSNLFPMLEGGRFDYFPRGLHEPWQEIINNQDLNLAVEKNILIKYTAPNYFFVKKGNHQLAKQITYLLNKLISEGEFERLFFADKEVKNALEKADVKNRIVFTLENPLLSEQTPLHRNELWFDPIKGQ